MDPLKKNISKSVDKRGVGSEIEKEQLFEKKGHGPKFICRSLLGDTLVKSEKVDMNKTAESCVKSDQEKKGEYFDLMSYKLANIKNFINDTKVQTEVDEFKTFFNKKISRIEKGLNSTYRSSSVIKRGSKLFTYFRKIFPQLNDDNFNNLDQIEQALQTDLGISNKSANLTNMSMDPKRKLESLIVACNTADTQRKNKIIEKKQLFTGPSIGDYLLDDEQIDKASMKARFVEIVETCNENITDYYNLTQNKLKEKNLKVDMIPDRLPEFFTKKRKKKSCRAKRSGSMSQNSAVKRGRRSFYDDTSPGDDSN